MSEDGDDSREEGGREREPEDLRSGIRGGLVRYVSTQKI